MPAFLVRAGVFPHPFAQTVVKLSSKSVEISARSLWQVYALPAVMFYLTLSFGGPAFAAGAPQQRGAWPVLKTAVPWAAGALLVFGPLAYMHRARRRLRVGEPASIESIRHLSRRELERVLAESFRLQGYAVEERAANKFGDGVCVVLRKPGQKIVVRCIHRTGVVIGVDAMSELDHIMSSEAASGGLVVTSEEVSSDARAWMADKPIGLIDGRALLELVNRGRARAASAEMTLRREPHLGPPLAELLDCPLCGAPMVLKDRDQGSQPAAGFFGCSVPRCPGTRPA
jgi:restriction system protein